MKEGSVVEISFPSKPIFYDARRCDMYDDDDDHAAVADYKQEVQHFDEEQSDEEEYVREGTYEGKKFPPKPSDWEETSFDQSPNISYDLARGELCLLHHQQLILL